MAHGGRARTGRARISKYAKVSLALTVNTVILYYRTRGSDDAVLEAKSISVLSLALFLTLKVM